MYFYRLAVNKKSCSKLFRELHALSIRVKRPKGGKLNQAFRISEWRALENEQRERERESINTETQIMMSCGETNDEPVIALD